MELDLLFELDCPKPWPGGQREAERAAYLDRLEQAKVADRVGFKTVWLVEHHFKEERSHCPAPEVFLGALSQVTERIRLGFGVALMPHQFSHPIRVAERVAVVDVLSGGRVELGTGRSTAMEQAAFGVPLGDESRAQWKEAVETVVAAWMAEGDSFSWSGKYLQFPARPEHHGTRSIVPKPVQVPHPPVWMAAAGASSCELAGRSGIGLLSFALMQPVEVMAEQIQVYRDAVAHAEPLTHVVNNKVGVMTIVHCADSREQAEANRAWEAAWWWYQSFGRTALEWDFRQLPEEKQAALFPMLKKQSDGDFDIREFNDADMIIVGDVDDCVEKMSLYAAAGVDHLLCYVNMGGLPHDAVMRSIELLGTEVLPALRQANVQTNPRLVERRAAGRKAPPPSFEGSGDLNISGAPPVSIAPGGVSD
jgi:alkanesulfonate monooxygenase SsuD/methylene tetrahydromethanopterin reductase-like flavin-dependent oxidoreductase (luciferase family)